MSSPVRSSSISRRRLLAVGSLAAALALTAGGCTSARNGGASAEAVKGGTITYAVALDALPSGIFGTLERNYPWINNVFQPVLQIDPDTREPKPVLATSWNIASDGLSIELTLHEGVTFHTGRAMSAEDVKYTFEQAADPQNASNLGFVARSFTSITVKSPTELTVTMSEPQPSLLEFLDQTLIIDKETAAGLKDGTQVVGTGPFTFGNWKQGASYELVKYPGYWNVDEVNLDRIEYVVTTDATAEISAVRSGRAQMASGLTPTDAQAFASGQHRLLPAGGTIYNLGLNVSTAPLDDVRVRQAVAYAIDGERINKQVLAGVGEVSNVFWSAKAPGVDETLTRRYTYDPERAKQLVAEAGAAGAEVPITYGANPIVRAMYSIVANNLTEIGLKPVSKAVDQPAFSAGQSRGDLGAAYLSLHGQVGLSPVTLINSLPPLRAKNANGFWPQKYQDLRAELLAAPADQAGPATAALSRYLLDELPSVPIVQAPAQIVVSSTITGVESTIRGPILLEQAAITK
ncbi:ABC transporter substrate-binding protein [Plantactinospora sp. KBS50]|uniref:ABC transporter substrate-binding protein n=1 Tax=Plantactinospora sp. KBS50 TaxID=2024580 RepID=UPI0012FD3F81|nr:ABC transporter substrate-binding protein [Plantactinospora sp. KBS50]